VTRYTYLGPQGTFAEQALFALLAGATADVTPARSVPEALDAVRRGAADHAVVPLENSIGGQVGVTLDELAAGEPLQITRDVVLPVQFVLAAAEDRPLTSVRTVAAHPQASLQCREWLRQHVPGATVTDVLSNADAAQQAGSGAFDAAVCAAIGAEHHHLAVLAKDIADHADALTRFALVSRPGSTPPPTGDDLTSLAVYIAHDRVGALLAVLTELSVRGINLTRIESRPTGERLGRYVFFLDCAGHVAEARMGEALKALHRICADVRFFGSYPRAGLDEPPLRLPGLADHDFAEAEEWLGRIRSGHAG
jgi:prephenate dehydratase